MSVKPARVLILIALGTVAPAVPADPDIEANRPVMDFGSYTYFANGQIDYALWIFNRGSTDLHIGDLGGANPLSRPFAIGAGCAHQTLRPSEHCEVTIIESMAAIGTHEDSFDIASDDPDEPAFTITTRGRIARRFFDGGLDGIAAPAILVCENQTTGKVVRKILTDTSAWDCLHPGFATHPRDRVKATILGRAEADTFEDSRLTGADMPGAGSVVRTAPNLVVSPLVIDFGRVSTMPGYTAESVDVTNESDVSIHFTEVGTTNPLAEPFFVEIDRLSHADCAPHAGCPNGGSLPLLIGMRVAPGAFSDSFSITSDDPLNPVITVQVVGEGVPDMITGTVIGLRGDTVVTCQNLTTGQGFQLNDRGWNCTEMGLNASAGDLILTGVTGLVE